MSRENFLHSQKVDGGSMLVENSKLIAQKHLIDLFIFESVNKISKPSI